MPTLLVAQSSDLDLSVHRTTYKGDSTLMAPLLEKLRDEYQYVIVDREELCSEEVSEIGEIEIEGRKYLLLYQVSGIGNSCRGVNNLLIFEGKQFAGFYRSDLDWSFWIKDNTLCATSSFRDSAFDEIKFRKAFPDTLRTNPALYFHAAIKHERDK